MGVQIPSQNSEKRSGKNKPDFETGHPKRGSDFQNGILKKQCPKSRRIIKAQFSGQKQDYIRVKNTRSGYIPRIKVKRKGGIKTLKIGGVYKTPYIRAVQDRIVEPHYRGHQYTRGYRTGHTHRGIRETTTIQHTRVMKEETTKRANKRDKTSLKALQTKAFRDFIKHRTQSDKVLC